jgi:hypothetical protein
LTEFSDGDVQVTTQYDDIGRPSKVGFTHTAPGSTYYKKYTLTDADGDPQEYYLHYIACFTAYNPFEAGNDCIYDQLESIVLLNRPQLRLRV